MQIVFRLLYYHWHVRAFTSLIFKNFFCKTEFQISSFQFHIQNMENSSGKWTFRPRSKKEVFQPHLPVRLPCYDLAPVIDFTLGGSLRLPTLGTPDFHGLTGGVYKVRERIHRAIADARLLAIPASCRRVAACNPN